MLDLHTRTPLIANLEEQKGLDGLDDYLDFVHKTPNYLVVPNLSYHKARKLSYRIRSSSFYVNLALI